MNEYINFFYGASSFEEYEKIIGVFPKLSLIKKTQTKNYLVITIQFGENQAWKNNKNKEMILWETIVLPPKDRSINHKRYCSKQDALEDHKKIVNKLLSNEK